MTYEEISKKTQEDASDLTARPVRSATEEPVPTRCLVRGRRVAVHWPSGTMKHGRISGLIWIQSARNRMYPRN